MIKDISKIREELKGYEEVDLPYEFYKGCHIKYITLKGDDESFYTGGKFKYFGDNCIFLENKCRSWSVPTIKKNKDGSINYNSRFFIKEKQEEICDKKIEDLNNTINFQQSIIEKMSERLKELEITQLSLINEKREYEDLLQQNRYNYKEKCIENEEQKKIIKKYEKAIQKLSNSHGMFH